MDTTTHIVTGIGIAGLSFLDPVVQSHPEIVPAMLACTIIGSNAPDFDFIFKYKGNEAYVKWHRGVSHSIPAVLLSSLFIALIASFLNGGVFFLTFFLWTLVSVVVHVLFDLFNIYGTMALHPFVKRKIAFYLLPILDPIILFLHVIGFFIWWRGYQPGITFLFIYFAIILYIGVRYIIRQKVIRLLNDQSDGEVIYTLIPSTRLNTWSIIANREGHYTLGKYDKGVVKWSKQLEKNKDNKIIDASKKSKFVDYIMQHSHYLHAKIVKKLDGYEVHWFDLRYQSRIDEPFLAIIQLDTKLNLVRTNVKHGLIAAPEKA
ncbi:metal-dependent hydrolase [Evansella tamaricis]|uniref:Metal-dependent hydrolase n=1 Tax=Evansella tamaricis TaxID=2069301 RepID=A0ABS6JJB5_9BACI|nr:metal-dependent hydrolase [Evansella tamaricis]MBU9713755.1 metal-dependent hydrolase [Evansella tamaricis]